MKFMIDFYHSQREAIGNEIAALPARTLRTADPGEIARALLDRYWLTEITLRQDGDHPEDGAGPAGRRIRFAVMPNDKIDQILALTPSMHLFSAPALSYADGHIVATLSADASQYSTRRAREDALIEIGCLNLEINEKAAELRAFILETIGQTAAAKRSGTGASAGAALDTQP